MPTTAAIRPSVAETTSAREWSELGSRDLDHRTRGVRVAQEAIESKPSELSMLPPPSGASRLILGTPNCTAFIDLRGNIIREVSNSLPEGVDLVGYA
jgi:hypothetical protein